jgi:CHAT domain-containing protein
VTPHFGDPQERALLDQAELAWLTGDWSAALDGWLRLALGRLSRGGGFMSPHGRVLLQRIAGLAVSFGAGDSADYLLEAAATAATQEGNLIAADYISLDRAHLALVRGELSRALCLLRLLHPRISPLRQAPTGPAELAGWQNGCWPGVANDDRAVLLTRLFLVMGLWLKGHGYYGQAALLLRHGATHAVPPAPPLACAAWTALRLALAATLLEQGEFSDCEGILDETNGRIDPGQDPVRYVERLELRGKLALLRGDFGLALASATEVAEVCQRGGFRQALIQAVLNQAQVLLAINQTAAVDGLLGWAARSAHAVGDTSAAARAGWLTALCRARTTALGRPSTAPSVVDLFRGARPRTSSAALAEPPPELPAPESFLALFEDRALEFQWALAAGCRDRALMSFQRLQQVFSRTESVLIATRLFLYGAMLEWAAANVGEAELLLAEALPYLERLGLHPDLWQALRLQAACAEHCGDFARRDTLIQHADRVMDKLFRSLSPAQRLVYGWNKAAAEEQALALEARELAEAFASPNAAVDARWEARVHDFQIRLDRDRRLLAAAQAGLEVPSPSEIHVEEYLHAIPGDRAVLSFLVLPEAVFVCSAVRGHLEVLLGQVSRHELRDLVARWIDEVRLSGGASEADVAGEQLGAALRLDEMLDRLPEGVSRITIVPDDVLHAFPFAACRLRAGYLGERYALSVAFDRTTLPFSPAAAGAPALVIAVSRGASPSPRYPRGILPLFMTIPEAERVADWFRRQSVSCDAVTDRAASLAEVKGRWRGAAFIHAACHGIFRPDRPDESGLVLIPEEDAPEILSLRELSELRCPHLRHVTLSNCWLADRLVLPGSGSIGLAEVLCRAGAGSVLACLWPVFDRAGAFFMERFYHHALDLPRDEATAAARCDLRQHANAAWSHPKMWAGFQLYGDPGPLLSSIPD